MEFCGDIDIYMKNQKIEYRKETQGSYINSYTVKNIERIEIKNTKKIYFIENKANYIDYIQNKKKEDQLVIYHGGMYSPIKGELFKQIYKAGKNMQYYHWSDIDIGGFKIFMRLKEIIPELIPYKMDKESFLNKKDYWSKMDLSYIKKLQNMRNDDKYKIFYDVIDEMLKQKCKLEQESFIM